MFNMNFIKIVLPLLCVVFENVHAKVYNPWRYEEGQRWMLMPDEYGNIHFVDLELKCLNAIGSYDAQKSVKFLLHSREASNQIIKFGDSISLAASTYDHKKPTKMIAHGWNNNGSSPINVLLTEAFLKSDDVNVIVIDWGEGANSLYTISYVNVKHVGAFAAKMIDWLVEMGSSTSSFHLMGHSLGAHVVGIAARNVQSGDIPYVTGMDPANPLWESWSDRIRPSDALYVEIIHTDSGGLGIKDQVGDCDFYPNKGSDQPGCPLFDIGCSHSRAYELMADSIDHQGFMANECTNYEEMYYKKCANLSQLYMGGSKPKFDRKGLFYLKTNEKKPFYQGPKIK